MNKLENLKNTPSSTASRREFVPKQRAVVDPTRNKSKIIRAEQKRNIKLKKLFKKKAYLLLIILSSLFTASGQIFFSQSYKLTSTQVFSIVPINFFSAIAILAYGLGAILFLWALDKGPVSSIYPLSSISFVWATIGAIVFLHEQASIQKFSILIILAGIILISKE